MCIFVEILFLEMVGVLLFKVISEGGNGRFQKEHILFPNSICTFCQLYMYFWTKVPVVFGVLNRFFLAGKMAIVRTRKLRRFKELKFLGTCKRQIELLL